MKIFILSLFITVVSFAQYDSLRVTWADPNNSDLDSILLSYAKYYSPVDTTIFARINEGVEEWQGVSPDSGKLRIFAQAKDDSSNISAYSTPDTVTIGGTAGGGAYVTDSLVAYWEIADLSDGSVDEWFDGISNIRFTNNADTSLRPIKSGNSIVFDGDDYFRQTTSGGGGTLPIINDSLSIEVVMTLEAPDTTATSLIFGVRNTYMLSLGLASNRVTVYAFNGTTNAPFTNAFSTPFVGTHHIVVTWDGNTSNAAKIYLDGSLVADVGDVEGQIAGENRFFLGGESASSEVPAGTSLPLARIYTKELTSTQVTTNYNSTSVQGLIP